MWRAAFGVDERIVGRAVTLNRRPYAVVGVLPAAPSFNPHADLALPIGPDELAQLQDRRYRLVAHLAPGTTIEQANRDLEVLSASLAKAYPTENAGVRLFAEDLRTDLLDENRKPVLILYGVVSLILLLACANVATLLVMRSASRSGEFGMRLAIGSPPSHVWQLVLRSGLRLAIVGTAIGMVAALGLMRLAATVFFGVSPTDGWVYVTCGALAVAAVLVASAAPALGASRIDPATVLRCD